MSDVQYLKWSSLCKYRRLSSLGERMKKKKRFGGSISLKIQNAKDKHISINIIIASAQW